jgi:hypothetical protein
MNLKRLRKLFDKEGIRYSYSFNELAFSLNGVFVIRQGNKHEKSCIICQYVDRTLSSSFEFNNVEVSASFIYFLLGDGKFNITR